MNEMKSMPLVSVMMPAYNASSSISDAIKSVRAQTYEKWELICYDDGSTDDTAAIVESIAAVDPRVRLYRGVHGGRGRARNAALQHCTGEFVAMCDADDISFPNRFAEQVDFLLKHPDIDAVGAFQVPFSVSPLLEGNHVIEWPLDAHSISAKFDALRMGMPNCVSMVRASCFVRVGGFDEALLRSQDFGFFLKLHRAGGRFANLAMPLVYYRQDGNIPSYQYWFDSEKYHALAVARAGMTGRGLSLGGHMRRLLNRRMMRLRYLYFRMKRGAEIKRASQV